MKLVTAFFALVLLLAGCASVKESTPIQQELARKGMVVTRALPTPLPSGSTAIPGSQYIIVNASSTAFELVDMINPIPFVGDLAKSAMRRREAEGYQSRYSQVDPFSIAKERMAGSALISGHADALSLMPFVYMVEGSDGRWRLSLTFRVDSPKWVGRFMYHLPTTYTGEEMTAAAASTQATLRQELSSGSDVLRQLMEKDARGELKDKGARAEFGSYYIVGSSVAGLVPAQMVHFYKAQVLDEGPDHVVLRSSGDLHTEAGSGALAYGVHYFRKDQLNDFKMTP